MSVFVDTGVLYAHHDSDAERHERAVTAMDSLLDGTYGQPYVSDHVLDEAVTLTRVRTGSFGAAEAIARRILGEDPYPTVFTLVDTDSDHLRAGLETFRRYDDHDLSFTDAVSISLCDQLGIDAVLSFDSDFDGLVDRLEPSA